MLVRPPRPLWSAGACSRFLGATRRPSGGCPTIVSSGSKLPRSIRERPKAPASPTLSLGPRFARRPPDGPGDAKEGEPPRHAVNQAVVILEANQQEGREIQLDGWDEEPRGEEPRQRREEERAQGPPGRLVPSRFPARQRVEHDQVEREDQERRPEPRHDAD